MADIASSDNNEIVTVVVGSLEGIEVVNSKASKLISVTLDWLTHHVVTVSIVMSVLKSSGLHVLVVASVVGSDFLLKEFELGSIKSGVGNGVTKKFNSTRNVVLEDGHTKTGLFTARFTVKAGTEGLDFIVEFGSGVGGGATGQHVAENVGCTGSRKSIITGTSTDIDTNGGGGGQSLLSGNADAV